jgi:hypothetical protein
MNADGIVHRFWVGVTGILSTGAEKKSCPGFDKGQ